ncbi:MAG: hypothetical protein LUP95_03675 [Euryarchaeota archaeon]|nr:hypothetical protein [Euryarchaeota archaeon]
MTSGIVVNGMRDALAVASQILESAREEVIWLIPPSLMLLSTRYGFIEKARAFSQRGGVSRGIVPLWHANSEDVQMSLDFGADVRHSDITYELLMFVGDKQQSISAINIGVDEFTLDTHFIAFWSEDPTYAEYLLASFESAWSEAVSAEQRIQELEQEIGQR